MTTTQEERTELRRALEALRNGVPNRAAVRVLGSQQTEAQDRFDSLLRAVAKSIENEEPVAGLLIAGGFGAGKSHVLEHLQHVALERNFVCSRVVISKETPLYDPAKVFLAAVDSAVVPDRRGQAVSGSSEFSGV